MCDDQRDRLLSRTLALARRGGSDVIPNPMVGAVITSQGCIIGEGYHARYGEIHAETAALKAAGNAARGATLYCNLEPCSFEGHGKHQPPCTRTIIAAGIRRVVIGQLDPNPRVRGNGVAQLLESGVQVEVVDDEASWRLNERFNTHMALTRPYVHLKAAVSLDGRIATAGGDSKWISDSTARGEVHNMRTVADAVAVGLGTVLTDDPRLTARDAGGSPYKRQPRPVVFDSSLRIPMDSHLVRDRAAELIVVTCDRGRDEKRRLLEELAVTVVPVQTAWGRPSVSAALRAIFDLNIRHVLVEGGGRLITSFLRENVYDRLTLYVAPCVFGNGYPVAGSLGIDRVDQAIRFEDVQWRTLGDQRVFTAMREGWLSDARRAAQSNGLETVGSSLNREEVQFRSLDDTAASRKEEAHVHGTC